MNSLKVMTRDNGNKTQGRPIKKVMQDDELKLTSNELTKLTHTYTYTHPHKFLKTTTQNP